MTPPGFPSSTYRIQFNINFRFADARELVPYLYDLGISDLYASPRFKARKGSSHGYDVADPARINSDLGTEEEYEQLVQRLKDYGMGLLLDEVPNHMAMSAENPWWMDVLENGPHSRYADYFDIEWHPAITKLAALEDNKVLLPVLGDLYGRVLENQEITLRLEESGLSFRYGEARFPLALKTYRPILEISLGKLRDSCGAKHPAVQNVLGLMNLTKSIDQLPGSVDSGSETTESRTAAQQEVTGRLWQLFRDDADYRQCLEATLRDFHGTVGEPRSFDLMDQLLSRQAYRIAFWRTARETLNYRRFFDINELIALRVEVPEVFSGRHAAICKLVEEGKVTGLRIDHIDGLYDPRRYLEDLRKACCGNSPGTDSSGLYVIVEKILGGNERLPKDWPVAGTTGYDFLNAVNGVFVDAGGLGVLETIYAKFVGAATSFAEWSYRGNRLVIDQLFPADFRRLGTHLGSLAAQDRHVRDVPLDQLLLVLADITACLPVYRTYISSFEVTKADRTYLERALKSARAYSQTNPFQDTIFDFFRRLLYLDVPDAPEELRQDCLRFVMRWQQFSGPVMAKGLEDTAFYIHNSLISLNEVGGDPLRREPPCDVESFHLFNQRRLDLWPATLNCTSTHDTKRSEDVRARINVLSELAAEWEHQVLRWRRWNRPKKQRANGQEVPTPLEEMFLYQILVGTWPLDGEEIAGFTERLDACMIKAAREAKFFTSWLAPQQDHEAALRAFVEIILDTSEENRFLKDFLRFQERVAFHGALNSLSQVLLKIGAPGVPDFYQGTTLWDFSMMDPDNRRPVDFQKRARMLAELAAAEHNDRALLISDLLEHWQDGRIKLYLTWKALQFRRAHNNVFAEGSYTPLSATGKRSSNLCAFARRKGKDWALIAAPIMTTRLVEPSRMPLGQDAWGSSAILLPQGAPPEWQSVFTGETLRARASGGKTILLAKALFGSFPVALFEATSA